MTSAELPPDLQDSAEPDSEEWVEVGHFASLHQAHEHGLVILAMGEACRVVETEVVGEYELQAEAHPAPRVATELDAYRQEAAAASPIPPRLVEGKTHPAGWWLICLWVLALMVVFEQQTRDPSLVSRAASSNLAFFDLKEWWRPFTALFLHANLSHLAGNLVSGVIFGALVSRALGAMKAWAVILACGTVGNIITARITYPVEFVSLGASTAVFAALGILSGLGVSETLRDRARLPWARIAAPVVAGLILLGWLGGSHLAQTDVLGHVFGFSSGLVAGGTLGSLQLRSGGDAKSAGTEA
jgi:membrane associated rhomboid family serine protease